MPLMSLLLLQRLKFTQQVYIASSEINFVKYIKFIPSVFHSSIFCVGNKKGQRTI